PLIARRDGYPLQSADAVRLWPFALAFEFVEERDRDALASAELLDVNGLQCRLLMRVRGCIGTTESRGGGFLISFFLIHLVCKKTKSPRSKFADYAPGNCRVIE